MSDVFGLARKLTQTGSLTKEEYVQLVDGRTPEITEYLRLSADEIRRRYFGNKVFIRGLIEIGNICKNDCFYCGIRAGNTACDRYRLTPGQILDCAVSGYNLGYRTVVLQGGEDPFFSDEVLCELIADIKKQCPGIAVTLSLGERSEESYLRLKNAGADRYLLRHETAVKSHYEQLHPDKMCFDNRMNCLKVLHKLGFQTGCGFMVGSPFQTTENIAADLKFIEEFKPEMCGIGPFIPHKDTPFASFPAGTAELTVFLLSVIRIICPKVLLPATTALGTISDNGRELGILAGANVVMPNLSPEDVRDKYSLYDKKIHSGAESAQNKAELEMRMKKIGFEVVLARGDSPDFTNIK